MASNNPSTDARDRGVVLQAPTIPGTSEGGGGSSSASSSAFQGIASPEALAILMDFIRQTAGGGTEEQRRQRAERNTQIQSARGTLEDYTKNKAFLDAADLMAQNLRQSLEKNMPTISKSIQGAGTSSSSMQGLLAQKLATESAQAAGAMGAEQAKAYGNISAQLQSVLEALTRIDPSVEANLLKALDLTRVSTSHSAQSSVQSPTRATTASGGGSFFQPFSQSQGYNEGGGAVQAVANQSVAPGQGYVVNNNTGQGTQFSGGNQTPVYIPAIEASSTEGDNPFSWMQEGYNYGPSEFSPSGAITSLRTEGTYTAGEPGGIGGFGGNGGTTEFQPLAFYPPDNYVDYGSDYGYYDE